MWYERNIYYINRLVGSIIYIVIKEQINTSQFTILLHNKIVLLVKLFHLLSHLSYHEAL